MKGNTLSMRDRVRKRAETRRNMGGLDTLNLPEGVELFKPEKGTVEFDVIPYRVTVDNHPEVSKGDLWYERTYLAHRNVGPEERFIICPKTIGKRCPICEEYARLKKDPDAEEEAVAALKAKERELFNVVLKDGDGAVMVLDISTFLFGQMLEAEIRENEDAASFAELEGGKTLKVRWMAKSMGTQKFVEAGRIDFVDREDFGEDVLDAVVDLDASMKILSYDEIAAIFHGGDEPGTAGEGGGGPQDDPAPDPEKGRRVIGHKPAGKPAPTPPPGDNLPGLEDPDTGGDKEVPGDCIACDGTGRTTKGKICPICNGTRKDLGAGEDPGTGEGEGEGDPDPEPTPAKRTVVKRGPAAPAAPAGRRVIRR